MKKIVLMTVIGSLFLLIAACGQTKKDAIVVTLYPEYDVIQHIIGDTDEVVLLTPLGSEVHDYSPSAKDVAMIKESALFVYTSDLIEPWALNLISDEMRVVNLETYYDAFLIDRGEQDDDDDHDHDDDDDDHDDDEHDHSHHHFFADPLFIISLINDLRDVLIELYPQYESLYTNNALKYYHELLDAHNALSEYISSLDHPKIYFASHDSLGAFAHRYGLEISTLSSGFEPDQDLSPQQIISITNEIKTDLIKTLFIDALEPTTAAITIQNELKSEDYLIELVSINSFHNITYQQFIEGVSYVDLLKENHQQLKSVLDS